ncbi:MAG: hypothetical protein NT069_35220 [Planctomycetota bacterium]|nr:hypothetical protein [Planctomycetota bacterium]
MTRSNKSAPGVPGRAYSPEDVVRFYQQLGFFSGADPTEVVQRYAGTYGVPPNASKPWDDVFLLSCAEGAVWAEDPEQDVCIGNEVYTEVLPQWAGISQRAFAPVDISEQWESETGPITVSFHLGGESVAVSPKYQDDWIDLEVLRQVNSLIATTGREFACAVDGNFVLVLCLTPNQKSIMRSQRQFPFLW